MRARQSGRPGKDPLRPVLGIGLSVLGIGAVLLVISVLLGSNPDSSLQALSRGLRVPVPYVLFLGLALLVLYAVRRPKRGVPLEERNDPSFFGSQMTDFVSHLHRTPPEMRPVDVTNGAPLPPVTAWSPRVFEDIGWRRFEALCASLFAQPDLEVREDSYGADGGVDLWLHSPGADRPAAVVHCRHRLGKPVGVEDLREFHGVMAQRKLHYGKFATSSTFTDDARQFAKDNGISTLDGQDLLELISRRTPAEQQSLLAIASGATG
jgi:restriction system protein